MVRYCVIPGCGKRLRTGNKYCHIHRSEGRHGKRQTKPNVGLVIIIIFIFIFIGMALQGLGEIFKAFTNFISNYWIIILIISASIMGFEIWRISKKGIRNISKFERVIFASSLVITFMIILAILFGIPT